MSVLVTMQFQVFPFAPGADLSLPNGRWVFTGQGLGDLSGGAMRLLGTFPFGAGYNFEGVNAEVDAAPSVGSTFLRLFTGDPSLAFGTSQAWKRAYPLLSSPGLAEAMIDGRATESYPKDWVFFPARTTGVADAQIEVFYSNDNGRTYTVSVWGFTWDLRARQIGPRRLLGVTVPGPQANPGLPRG